MDNIRATYPKPASSDDYSVKKYLQEQFMSQITNQKDFKIPHLGIVEDRLKDKKVLVVLDDVDQLIQLQAMAKETCWFGPWSRIIITTQDQKLLRASGINHVYKVDFPSSHEALEIFCTYAFDQKFPKDGFEKLAQEVTYLAGSLPLGLRIIGSYFRGMYKEEWTNALPRLWTRLNREIESILKFSYDALCYEDKTLFLHIACFFNDEYVDTVEGCLANRVWDVTQGIHFLAEKSLISMDSGRIKMDKLLVQLGREIVRKQSDSEPWKRQFLVDEEDIREVLTDDNADSSSVIGINQLSYDNKDINDIICTSTGAFERLPNLQFLRIDDYGYYDRRDNDSDDGCYDHSDNDNGYYDHSDNDNDDGTYLYSPPNLNFISGKLRFLSWKHFPMTCFPSSFRPKYLVKLDMVYSKLEKLWEGIQPLDKLQWMNLSDSRMLKELPDLSTATNLQELNLFCCSSLEELPSSMKNLGRLSKLCLWGCSKLEVILTNINLESLKYLYVVRCSTLKSDPENSTNSNDDVELSGTAIQELGLWIERISRLCNLKLGLLPKMVSLPQLPYSITNLDARFCESLERLDCTFRNPDINRLDFTGCYKLNQEARDLIIHTPITTGYATLPGREVPECFTYRASGSCLTMKLNQLPLCTSTKFKAGIILDDNTNDYWGYVDCSITSKQNAHTYCTSSSKTLYPVTHDHLYIFEVEAVNVTSTELVFEFHTQACDDTESSDHEDFEIKECGVFQILEVP